MAERRKSKGGDAVEVVFVDRNYQSRLIEVGSDVLRVEHGRVTARTPEQVEALDKMFGMVREESA